MLEVVEKSATSSGRAIIIDISQLSGHAARLAHEISLIV